MGTFSNAGEQLSFIYRSQGFTIYPHRHTIEYQGNSQVVRPKTFALLLLLLQHPQQILSKRFLIDTVWDDVTVEEQVLVQSIRELRQLFNSAEIIQTYPRKGYAWSAQVDSQPVECDPLNHTVIEVPPPSSLQPIPFEPPAALRRHRVFLTSAALLIAVIIASYATGFNRVPTLAYSSIHNFFARITHPQKNSDTAVVIVLPVRNQMVGNDHNWVALGAMDQLIKALISDQHVQVMDAEYVLELMKNAQIPRLYTAEHIAPIFVKSGATLVVDSQLSGTVEDYRLDYTLHSHTNSQRGVVFAKSITLALQQLTQILAKHTGQSFNTLAADSQRIFNNELFARALEKWDAGELQLAQSLLTSLKQLEPGNMMVREILVQTLIQSQAFDAATAEINAAFAISNISSQEPDASQTTDSSHTPVLSAEVSNDIDGTPKTNISQDLNQTDLNQTPIITTGQNPSQTEKQPPTLSTQTSTRLHYFLANTQFQQGLTDQALENLDRALGFAQNHNDILYQAYIAQLRGVIQQKIGAYSLAEAAYQQALNFHGVIRCPVGMSISHLQLADVLWQQGKNNAALAQYNAAKELVNQHQLVNLIARLEASEPEK